jgi:hypothetical protein
VEICKISTVAARSANGENARLRRSFQQIIA